MLTAHASMDNNASGSGYGIVLWKDEGWHSAAGKGGMIAGNGGNIDGYSAVIYRLVDDRVTIAVLWNQLQESMFDLTDTIAKRLYNPN